MIKFFIGLGLIIVVILISVFAGMTFCSMFYHLSDCTMGNEEERSKAAYYAKFNLIVVIITCIVAGCITVELSRTALSDMSILIPTISFIVGIVKRLKMN
ncbi:MAG: hypothetical protein IJN43_02975 [Ruminococcus sp.]|nr:hypothetical protein [Ruminococcus sp.]